MVDMREYIIGSLATEKSANRTAKRPMITGAYIDLLTTALTRFGGGPREVAVYCPSLGMMSMAPSW